MVVFVGCGGAKSDEPKVISSVDELNENSPELIIWKKDGKVMKKVMVIEDYTELGKPIYRYYYTDAEYITVGQYKAFMEASGYRPKNKMNWESVYSFSPTDDDPMVNLSWKEVQACLKWVGKRLPSSSEGQERDENEISTWREDSYSGKEAKERKRRIALDEFIDDPLLYDLRRVHGNSDYRSIYLGILGVIDVP